MSTQVSCTIDLAAAGKQVGRLQLPRISNTGGWASSFVPIACIANGSGPTVLVLAGNHGDEYEGGANFNRSFPGSVDGPPNEQLADYLTRFLFPASDVVIDIHSGGRTAWFLPCSHMHVVDDLDQRRAMLAGMQAWNSDHHFLYIDVNGTGLLPVEAENQGKVVITTELGGGGRVPAFVHELAWSGLQNVLRHVGGREGEVQTRESLGKPPAVIIDGRDPTNYVIVEEAGLWEGLHEPGAPVHAGDPVGRLWFPDTPSRPPDVITAPLDGMLAVIRAIPPTQPGDSVFTTGQPIEISALV